MATVRLMALTATVVAIFAAPFRVAAVEPFGAGTVVATLDGGTITEASGLVLSRKNAGVLWIHNDSGERAQIFAVGLDGKRIATYMLAGAMATDYEDIAIGPGPVPGADYLYVADIGDNLAERGSITVYRVREPATAGATGEIELPEVAALRLRYPKRSFDAQTLLVDPRTRDLFVVTRDVAGTSRVFHAPYPQSVRVPTVLDEVARIRFEGDGPSALAATGGDIDPRGGLIVVRTYEQALLWERASGESVADALARPGVPTPVIGTPAEPQGEAIGFAADGASYFTLSEGIEQPLYRFDRVAAP